MKKLLTITLTLVLSLSLSQTRAQEEMQYLLGGTDSNVPISGFAGVLSEFSSFDKDFGFSMGGGAAMLFNQKIFIGGYGLGLTTQHLRTFTDHIDITVRTEAYYTRFGHGGFWFGYIHNPHKAIHFSVNAKLGWGAVSLSDETYHKDPSQRWDLYMQDNVFVITPQVDVNMNLLKWLRVNVGVGYRLVTGVDKTYYYMPEGATSPVEKEYFDKNAFNSVTGNITLAFGWFGK